MSKAGKKNLHKKPVTREATNLTLDIELKKWAAHHADASYNGSLSELLNSLLEAKKTEVEGGGENQGIPQAPTPPAHAPDVKAQHFEHLVARRTDAEKRKRA